MQVLDELSGNVNILLERYSALQQDNTRLKEEIDRQRQELIRTHAELVALQQQNRRLSIANSLTSAESAEQATKRLNAIIAQLDKAIDVLR